MYSVFFCSRSSLQRSRIWLCEMGLPRAGDSRLGSVGVSAGLDSEEAGGADSPRVPRPSTMEGVIVRKTMAAMLSCHAETEAMTETHRSITVTSMR